MHIVRIISASVFAAVMLFLAALHVYWARGGEWATDAIVPTIDGHRTFDAGPLPTYVVACLLVAAAVVVCGYAGLFATGSWSPLFRFGSWFLCGVFLLRSIGNFKSIRFSKTVLGTPFAYWDTHLYSPLCLVLAVLAGIVASRRE